MNRYLAEGVVADMRAGKHVLVLLDNRHAIYDVIDCVIEAGYGLALGETVTLTNSYECITGAGRIDFSSVGEELRSLRADVIVVDVNPRDLSQGWWNELMSTVGRRAELIRG